MTSFFSCQIRFYQGYPYPDENQQHLLGMELGLEPINIKYWFENKRTQIQIGRVTNLIENFIGNPELSLACNIPSGSDNLISTIDYLAKNGNVDNLDSVNLLNAHPEFEKIVMAKNAARAMEELIDHLINDNPFWIKFQNNGNYEFDSNNYDKFYYGSKIQRDPKSRVEYSKYSDIVTMNAKVLVDLLLDSDQWVDNFPTIISKATTVSVIEAGSLDNRSGSLQLVYKKMHSLPPINRPREYTLLQHCQEIKTGLWVIVNVSYNMFGGTYHNAPIHYWKHPSGWMIEQLPNGISKPMNPNERSEMIFQEIMTGPYESLIVYAAINEQNMIGVTNGMDCSSIPILASGFAITPNVIGGRAAPSASSSVTHLGGSLITVAFQVLACSSLDTIYVGDKPSKATKMVNNVVNTLKVVFKRPV
ncbi:homeobox-leucine zipper protein ROC8-like [Chenopodium quinoa]|uniref:homeobox-leucine zipper protein ROC8-like n=1 Tax=Chenopodium quinoa TaxID=63459 RepID=UPI000B78E444|nr:homeobox-leucine zipper protein ROC8-like [Chenopodium quinoa]